MKIWKKIKNACNGFKNKGIVKSITDSTFYKVVEMISSFAIFIYVILIIAFLISSTKQKNRTDYDLVIQDISNQLHNKYNIDNELRIWKIDMHGLGNNSIIAKPEIKISPRTTDDMADYMDKFNQVDDDIYIFEDVENSWLEFIYNPFNFKSTYILKSKFEFDLDHVNTLRVFDILDITHDGLNKEIILQLVGNAQKSENGSYVYRSEDRAYAVIGYDFATTQYKIIGSLPNIIYKGNPYISPPKYSLEDDLGYDYMYISNENYEIDNSNTRYADITDSTEMKVRYNFNNCDSLCFFVDSDIGKLLIKCDRCYDRVRDQVSLFEAVNTNGQLEWNILFAGETKDSVPGDSFERMKYAIDLINKLTENALNVQLQQHKFYK